MPTLIPQTAKTGLRLGGLYFNEPKRYILKSGHVSRDDQRVFDSKNGRLVYNSHHPGKNPYSGLDPLGLTNQDAAYQRRTMGAEWESLTDVSGHGRGYPSFKIRPKKLSRHGRQFIKVGGGKNSTTKFNIGKVGKLASMSMRPNFAVGPEEDDDTVLYTIVGDMMGRTMRVTNEKDELIAVMAKTTKALIMNAALGKGSESTIDVAQGVDCSLILAMVFGLQQVGGAFPVCPCWLRFFTVMRVVFANVNSYLFACVSMQNTSRRMRSIRTWLTM